MHSLPVLVLAACRASTSTTPVDAPAHGQTLEHSIALVGPRHNAGGSTQYSARRPRMRRGLDVPIALAHAVAAAVESHNQAAESSGRIPPTQSMRGVRLPPSWSKCAMLARDLIFRVMGRRVGLSLKSSSPNSRLNTVAPSDRYVPSATVITAEREILATKLIVHTSRVQFHSSAQLKRWEFSLSPRDSSPSTVFVACPRQ